MDTSKVLLGVLASLLCVVAIACDEENDELLIVDQQDAGSETDVDEEDRGNDSCAPFPESFSEGAAFAFNDPNFGQIVQYTEFNGLVEGHSFAEAIFDLAILKQYGAVFEPSEIDLSGRESSFDTCAYCIRFSEAVTMKNGKAVSTKHMFMPKSGTLTFESLSNRPGDLLKFQIDAEMIEVTLGANSQSIPVPGGCSFRLDNYTRTAFIKQ